MTLEEELKPVEKQKAQTIIDKAALMQAENAVGGVIELRAFWGKQQAPSFVQPATLHGRLMGVERLSPEQERNTAYVVKAETTIKLFDGILFDMKDEVSRINWEWIRYVPDIAESYDAAQKMQHPIFYVYSESKEIQKRVAFELNAAKAITFISESAPSKLYDYARLLGQNMNGQETGEVMEYLISIAKKTPKRVTDVIKDPLHAVRLFIFKALDKGTIKQRANNLFYYKDIVMGADEQEVAAYLQNSDNRIITENIRMELTKADEKQLGADAFDLTIQPSLRKFEPDFEADPHHGEISPNKPGLSRPEDFMQPEDQLAKQKADREDFLKEVEGEEVFDDNTMGTPHNEADQALTEFGDGMKSGSNPDLANPTPQHLTPQQKAALTRAENAKKAKGNDNEAK